MKLPLTIVQLLALELGVIVAALTPEALRMPGISVVLIFRLVSVNAVPVSVTT